MEKDEKVGGEREREIQEIEGGREREREQRHHTGKTKRSFHYLEDRLLVTKDEIQFSLTIQFF